MSISDIEDYQVSSCDEDCGSSAATMSSTQTKNDKASKSENKDDFESRRFRGIFRGTVPVTTESIHQDEVEFTETYLPRARGQLQKLRERYSNETKRLKRSIALSQVKLQRN